MPPRIVSTPEKGKGTVKMELCNLNGRITPVTITKRRHPGRYGPARKSAWGDIWSSDIQR